MFSVITFCVVCLYSLSEAYPNSTFNWWMWMASSLYITSTFSYIHRMKERKDMPYNQSELITDIKMDVMFSVAIILVWLALKTNAVGII
jgi:hypothetical protein